MSRREDAPPVLKPNHRAMGVLGDSHPEEIVQGEELSIKRVAAPLVRHRRPHRGPVHILAFRQLRKIIKVPEINSTAPVVTLFVEVMYDPVQGTRAAGTEFSLGCDLVRPASGVQTRFPASAGVLEFRRLAAVPCHVHPPTACNQARQGTLGRLLLRPLPR